MLGLLTIIGAIGALIFLAYRGLSLLVIAPVMAVLAGSLGGGLPMLATYTQIYMANMGDFIIAFFPLFLLGAIFGRLMEDTGAARTVADTITRTLGAERAILAVVLCCAILTYGGVSLFVVAFAVFPVAAELFRRSDTPKRLIPAALALGAFTFTMSALPGTPAIQNAIPTATFGTTAFAAPGLGIVAGILMLAFGMGWLRWRSRRAIAAGEGYGAHDDALWEEALSPGAAQGPNLALAIAPIVIVVAINLAFAALLPRLDTAYLSDPIFGPTTIDAVRGVWAIIAGLVAAIVFLIATNTSRIESLQTSLDEGAKASLIPIANTASLVGFGAVIAAMPAFATISNALLALGDLNPVVSLALAVNVLSAITGSASGGMSIALEALGPTYVELARAQNISLEIMHRVTSISSGALDALPHNGAVITVLGICKLTHREAYADLFMVAVIGPLLSLAAVITLASVFGGI